MDEQGDFVLPENLRTNRNIKIFSIASIKAGHVVGRMLLNAGHRNIAYLSIGADQPWSARRFNGLKKTFENIDNSAGIHLVSGNNSLPVEPQIKRNIQSIEDFVQLYESLWKKNLPSLNLAAYTMQLQTLLSQEYAYTQLVPLLQRALELRSTAWVFENDQLAGLALTNFIRQNNISVPDNLAVVGFDDTAVAANINLTSYNFDFGGIARTAISFILNPEHRIYWNKTRIECEGLVIERNSTRGHYSPIT